MFFFELIALVSYPTFVCVTSFAFFMIVFSIFHYQFSVASIGVPSLALGVLSAFMPFSNVLSLYIMTIIVLSAIHVVSENAPIVIFKAQTV